MSALLAWSVFLLGGWLCAMNGYLSFLRRPFRRLRNSPKESDRWVSGVPLIGSLLVALSLLHPLLHLRGSAAVLAVGIGVMAVDTGGIHWFVGTMVYRALFADSGQ